VKIIAKEDSKRKFIQKIELINKYLKNKDLDSSIPLDYLVIGGDGSLNYFINQLSEAELLKESRVLYLPDGTANDFSRSLGIAVKSVDEYTYDNLKDILHSNFIQEVPIMRCNDRYFLNTATIAAPARVTESGSNQVKELLGQWSYYISAIEEVIDNQYTKVKVNILENDRVSLSEVITGLGFAVGQGLYAGGGVKVTDHSRPLLGKSFYATMSRSKGITDSLKSLIKMQNSKLNEEDAIFSKLIDERIDFIFENNVPVKIDGEPYEADQLTFRKTEHKLNFLIH
jgi:diacylglycerol kinase family enzyme